MKHGMCLLLLTVSVAVIWSTTTVSSQSDCTNVLISMAPYCLGYITGNSICNDPPPLSPLSPPSPPSPPHPPSPPSPTSLKRKRERGREREREKERESSPELVAGATVCRDHVQLATTDKRPR